MDEKTICIIILILACILILLYLFWQIKKNGLRATVVNLIVYAEKTFMQGENKAKFNYVVTTITSALPIPAPFKLFITPTMIETFVQSVFDEIKEALDYSGKNY